MMAVALAIIIILPSRYSFADLVSMDIGNFVSCSEHVIDHSRPINFLTAKCVNDSTTTNFPISQACFVDWGFKVMMETEYHFYQGICNCRYLQSVRNQFSCALGAYKAWVTKSVAGNDPSGSILLFPCINAVEFPAACYRILWETKVRTITVRDAHIACLGINEKLHRHSCVYGIGYAFSSKYYSNTGKLFPIHNMCSAGNTADKIMCIHGYWDGVNVSTSILLAMKSHSCQHISADESVRDACMLRGNMDIPINSPLFQSSTLPFITLSNLTQANMLLVYGANQTLLSRFRRIVQSMGRATPQSTVEEAYNAIGANAILYAYESAWPRCDFQHCHAPCHAAGRQVYLDVQNLEVSMHICGRSCQNACFHGSYRQWFMAQYNRAPVGHVENALRPYYSSFEIENSTAWNVYSVGLFDTLGHAIMETIARYQYRKGLDECKYTSSHVNQYHCASGVWDEYFDGANYTIASSNPCNNSDVDFPAACYFFFWRALRLTKPLEVAQNLCLSISNDLDRRGCFYGLGYSYAKEMFRNRTARISDICSRGDFDDRSYCVNATAAHMRSFFIDMPAMCSSLTGSLWSMCIEPKGNVVTESNLALYFYTADMRMNRTAE